MNKRLISVNKPQDLVFEDCVTFDFNHQREEVSFLTPDLEIFYDKSKKGWTFKRTPEGFLMRAPETWLVDTTDPYKITFYEDPIVNLAYYEYLKEKVRSGSFGDLADFVIKKKCLGKLQYHLLSGSALESEIRIAGSDSRIKDFKKGLKEEAIETKDYDIFLRKTQSYLQGCRNLNYKKISIKEAPIGVSSFFYLLKENYGLFDNFKEDTFNPLYFPDLFKDVPDFDVYIFIPWGCFRYISSFVNPGNRDKIMFWELHFDQYQTHTNRYLSKDLENKRVLILDNSYTGNTLTKARSLVINEGGIPYRLALFPKSKLSVVNSEYVLFIDKVLKSDTIDLINNNWITDTYKRVLESNVA